MSRLLPWLKARHTLLAFQWVWQREWEGGVLTILCTSSLIQNIYLIQKNFSEWRSCSAELWQVSRQVESQFDIVEEQNEPVFNQPLPTSHALQRHTPFICVLSGLFTSSASSSVITNLLRDKGRPQRSPLLCFTLKYCILLNETLHLKHSNLHFSHYIWLILCNANLIFIIHFVSFLRKKYD